MLSGVPVKPGSRRGVQVGALAGYGLLNLLAPGCRGLGREGVLGVFSALSLKRSRMV